MARGPPPGYQQYVAALAVLGLVPGALIDAVRAAHKLRLKECHPDLYPGDKAKEEQAKALNAARELLEGMSADGLLPVYAAMAERDRRTGSTADTASVEAGLVVFVIMAPAGAGKTQGWAQATASRGIRRPGILVQGRRLHVILASPTTNLIDQTAEALAMAGLDKPLVTVLHSKNTGSSSVAEAVRRYYGRTNSNTDAVLLISHQAVFDTPLPIDPENWDICFDEVPDCVSFIEVEAPESHYFITRAINANPLGPEPVALYSLSPLQDNEMAIRWLHRIAWNRPKFDQGFAHLQEWARALIHGHTILVPGVQWDALMEKKPEGGHLDLLIIVPPIWFQQYRSISVMGARVTTHFTALIWSKIWQVQFKQVNLYKLPTTHSALQSRRLTVHWIFAEPVTRAFLARKAPDGGNLFVAACKSVAAFYDGKPFLWSAPQPGEDREHGVPDTFWSKAKLGYPDAFDHELRLPGRTHGLNRPEFLKACNVALLSTVHLTPTQYALLHDLELTDEQIDRALQFDVAYQDAARCNIRLADSRKPVSITVLDQRTALELAEQFPGGSLERWWSEIVE